MTIEEQRLYADHLLSALPDGIITIFPDGHVVHVNLMAQNALHINASSSEKYQAGNLYISDLLSLINNDQDILPDILEKLKQGEREVELPQNTCVQEKAMNTLFPIKGQFFAFQIEEGRFEIVFHFHDVTSELTQEYILNTALRRTRIYPWFLDIDRGVFVLDPRYFEYLGIPAGPNNTLTMEEYTNRVHPDDRQPLADAFSVQFSGNTIYEKPVPFRILRGDGRWEWFEGQSTYIGRLSGLPYRLVGICMSIQEHKNIEATLIAARNRAEESDRLKSAFLANMSHEIRTPLNAIVGFSDILISSLEDLSPEERESYVSIIKQNSTQLLVLVGDILDLSKIESNTMKFTFLKMSLRSIFEDVFHEHMLNNKSDVKLILDIPKEEIMIVSDPVRLKQVLNNLMSNALKFTSKGEIHLGFETDGDNSVRMFIEDTGTGISEDHLDHIFERFYKVDSFKQGTGLGLSICKTIVDRLHGDISVISKVNEGSCFTVELPLEVK